jgi:hypothetical protein
VTNSGGKSSHTAQMIGSLLVAVLIVVVTISVVTARLGVDEDSGGGSDSSEEDGSGRGRGRGRSGSGMRESAPVRFALRLADVPDEFLGRRVGGALDETP